ncbi:3-deoxy-8-phosphooctulonate synthase [Methylocella sp.]|uniref:3-deoxy-8-phosphooctulonate synthase n=1 Tax=Methylocella sp. TaxID=1978226 RepID=UPI003785287C
MSGASTAAPAARVEIGGLALANDLPLVLIAGPCQMESRAHALECAQALAEIAARAKIGLIYKTSFDKANRTSIKGRRGVGLKAALPVFAELRERFGLPLLTDVHLPEQCAPAAEVVDVLQIPALLSRQTDLILAAAATGRVVNIKKGQFAAPWDMAPAVEKARAGGGGGVLLTERGTSFGYNSLIVDMRSLVIMAGAGCPIVFDATHSTQSPGGLGDASGGDRAMAPALARAAVAVGVAAVFAEAHPDPDRAPSDGPSMLPIAAMPELIESLMAIDAVAKGRRGAN